MNKLDTHNQSNGQRALVLGGGGSAGNAWLIGVVAGLYDAGLDVTNADMIIGTSAGSTAAAQIASMSPKVLFEQIISEVHKQSTRPNGTDGGRAASQVASQMDRTSAIIASSTDASDMRRRMGAAALEIDASTDNSRHAQWRSVVASRLPSQEWPQQQLLVTAVDAHTGEGVVFSRDSGVDLADAIAASTSSGPPYAIADKLYIDGGYRRNENADLAAGYAKILVLSPFGGRTRHPLEWGMQLSAQIDELIQNGSKVETIYPDKKALEAFGNNMMNLSARIPAAKAGYEQGKNLSNQLTEFWN